MHRRYGLDLFAVQHLTISTNSDSVAHSMSRIYSMGLELRDAPGMKFLPGSRPEMVLIA